MTHFYVISQLHLLQTSKIRLKFSLIFHDDSFPTLISRKLLISDTYKIYYFELGSSFCRRKVISRSENFLMESKDINKHIQFLVLSILQTSSERHADVIKMMFALQEQQLEFEKKVALFVFGLIREISAGSDF